MIETLVFILGILLTVFGFGVLIYAVIGYSILQRKRRSNSRSIPSEIQQEIDQTLEWWDREFRKLSGEPEPREKHWSAYMAENTRAIQRALSVKSYTEDGVTYERTENGTKYASGGWVDAKPPSTAELAQKNRLNAFLLKDYDLQLESHRKVNEEKPCYCHWCKKSYEGLMGIAGVAGSMDFWDKTANELEVLKADGISARDRGLLVWGDAFRPNVSMVMKEVSA